MKVFKSKKFISCADNSTEFTTLIEDQGRILYTGNDIPDQYKTAEVIELGGECALPSFFDTHIHFSSFAFFNSGLDCRHAKDFEELGNVIKDYVAKNPKEKIILGFGSSAHTVKEKRLPTMQDLDKITDHPLLIVKYDGHAAIGNSALLKKLPPIVFKTRGFQQETGQFFQESFYEAVNSISKKIPLPKIFTNLIEGANQLMRKGVGYIHSAEGVGIPFDVDLMRLAGRGLPITIKTFYQTMKVSKVTRRKMNCVGGCFETALDGCFGSVDAAMRAPYNNDPENKGVLFYDQETVTRFICEAHDKGLQVAVHAIGDAAIDQGLNAFEEALRRNPRVDHRHIIIHADLMDEGTIKRAKDLGVVIALQTPFLHWDLEPMEYLEEIMGERTQLMIPVKKMLEAGLLLAGGSDGPTTLPDPLLGIHAACNHPNPEQSIGVMDAIKMHTINAAKLSFDEKEHGSLEVGKRCNFVVLDKDILSTEATKLKDITVREIYLNGKRPKDLSGRNLKFLMDCLLGNK